MPRKASITQEQVSAAAESLQAMGQKPSARSIRDALGVGSLSTVNQLFNAWKASRSQASEPIRELPPALHRALTDWATKEASTATAALEEALASERQLNMDLTAEAERLMSEQEEQALDIERLRSEKAELEGRQAQLQVELEMLRHEAREQRAAAEASRTEAATLQLRLEALPRLESDMARQRQELEDERARRIDAEQNAAVAIARLEIMTLQVQDLQNRLTRIEGPAKNA